jgi:antitoxin HicB
LKEEGTFSATTAAAIKKVLTFQIEEEMQAQRLTKTAMAQRMHTSQATLNRLLDDKVTLTTMASA